MKVLGLLVVAACLAGCGSSPNAAGNSAAPTSATTIINAVKCGAASLDVTHSSWVPGRSLVNSSAVNGAFTLRNSTSADCTLTVPAKVRVYGSSASAVFLVAGGGSGVTVGPHATATLRIDLLYLYVNCSAGEVPNAQRIAIPLGSSTLTLPVPELGPSECYNTHFAYIRITSP